MKNLIALYFLFYFTKTEAQLTTLKVGDLAPDFTVTDLHGHTHTLSQYTYDGKYVVVDLFAYWCGPCKSTAPIIEKFYKKYGCNSGNTIVIGLESDGTNNQLIDFDKSAKLDSLNTYPAASGLNGGAAIAVAAYNPYAFPTIVLISPSGKLLNIDIWPLDIVGDLENAFPNGVLSPQNCSVAIPETDQDKNLISLYPNPAKENVLLNLNLTWKTNVLVSAYNIKGQLVYEKQFVNVSEKNFLSIETDTWISGLYCFKVNDGSKISVSKLIVD